MDNDRPVKFNDNDTGFHYYDDDSYHDDDNYDSHVPVVSIIVCEDNTESSVLVNNQLREESLIIMGEIASESIIRDVDYDIPQAVIHRSFLMVDEEEDNNINNNVVPHGPNQTDDLTSAGQPSLGTSQDAVGTQQQEIPENQQQALDTEQQGIPENHQQVSDNEQQGIGETKQQEVDETQGGETNDSSNSANDQFALKPITQEGSKNPTTDERKHEMTKKDTDSRRSRCCGWLF